MKKVFGLFCVLLILQSCNDDSGTPEVEDSKTSLTIRNASGKSFEEIFTESYSDVENFSLDITVGEFGFPVDTLKDGDLSLTRSSFTEKTASEIITRCRFNHTVYYGTGYSMSTYDERDTIELAETIIFELGKEYTLIIKDFESDVEFVENE